MLIDRIEKSIELKIVYFGSAQSGKTTSLKALLSGFGKEDQLKSVEKSSRRIVFLDYGTIAFPNPSDAWKLKVQIYSTTGQNFNLLGIDGIIFVIDSQKGSFETTLLTWKHLETYLEDKSQLLHYLNYEFPISLCFNKQDVPEKFNPDTFLKKIRFRRFKNIRTNDTISLTGKGILESFEDVLDLVFKVKTPYLLELLDK